MALRAGVTERSRNDRHTSHVDRVDGSIWRVPTLHGIRSDIRMRFDS